MEFTGDGRFNGAKWNADGRYTIDPIIMKYVWFHPGNISAHGSYHIDPLSLEMPDFEALLLGGSVDGHVRMGIPNLDFTAETKVHGFQLRQALAAEDNPGLPIIPLHWNSRMDIDAKTTWVADFKHVKSQGISIWTPPDTPTPGQIPTAAHFAFHFDMDHDQFALDPGEITTPSSRIQFRGGLSMEDSSIEMSVDTEDLTLWDDFINRLRGPDAQPEIISGRFHWQGSLTGPLTGPTFAGRATATDARYDGLYWDEIETELAYSPDQLHLERGRARRGRSSADLDQIGRAHV
jgi:hypothetical protein